MSRRVSTSLRAFAHAVIPENADRVGKIAMLFSARGSGCEREFANLTAL
jgi:hypothetical protein